MNYAEAKHRIIRKLPDDFLKDNGNREALDIMESLFDVLDKDDIQPIDSMMCANADMAMPATASINNSFSLMIQFLLFPLLFHRRDRFLGFCL